MPVKAIICPECRREANVPVGSTAPEQGMAPAAATGPPPLSGGSGPPPVPDDVGAHSA
jgi:hypothetical protein